MYLKCKSYVAKSKCTFLQKEVVTKRIIIAFLGEMKSHRGTHSGIKAFSCEQCGSTFTKRSSLNKHSLLHLGVRPYKCDSCNRKLVHLLYRN